jgi:HlyD family secretion protein
VVSYNVVVAVSNDDETLLPGMTANVRFTVDQKRNVLRVPNAALRYKPADADAASTPATKSSEGKRLLYRLEGSNRIPMYVKTGIADNNFTEIIEGEIKEGDELIVREISDKDKSGSKFRFRMF